MEYTGIPKETVNYDSMETALYIRDGRLRSYPNGAYPCHWHDEVEFLYVREGKVTYNVDGKLYLLREGEGIFVNAQRIHYGFSDDGSDGVFFCIVLPPLLLCATPYFQERFIDPVTTNEDFPLAVLTPAVPWMQQVLQLLLQVDGIYKSGRPGYQLEILGCYYRIWALLFQNRPEDNVTGKRSRTQTGELKRMLEFIQRNYAQKISMTELASAGHVCKSVCYRLFRDYLRLSPVDYINGYRLSRARELLADTSLPMVDIATSTGFSTASYFSELFRRSFGCTPGQYRRRNQPENEV